MPDSTHEPFEGWCVLELFGHRRLAGFVREVTVAGAGFLRLDVPGEDDTVRATQLYQPSAVFCLTPCTEATARQVAALCRPDPVQQWELPEQALPERELPASGHEAYPDEDDDSDPDSELDEYL